MRRFDRVVVPMVLFFAATAAFAACPDFSAAFYGLGPSESAIRSATGDFNRDGREDIVLSTGIHVNVLLQNPDGSFGAPNPLGGLNNGPWDFAVADLNGDGNLDIVFTNGSQHQYGIILGNGNGTFQAPVLTTIAGVTLSGVAVADFNRDGRPDLVIAESTSVAIYLQSATTPGTFDPPVTYVLFSRAERVAVADFNGDGVPDVAVEDTDGYAIGVLFGNPNGTLQTPGVMYDVPPLQSSPTSLVVADFNRDGKPDIAATLTYSDKIMVMINDGNGAFPATPKPLYTTGAGTYPFEVAVLDANGDGIPDLVSANSSTNNASVLLGNGAGAFASPKFFAAGDSPRTVAAGDLDHDGRADFIIGNYSSNNVTVEHNTGTCYSHCGTFSAPGGYGNGSNEVVLGDFNNDGKLDFVETLTATNEIEILAGTGDGGFQTLPTITFSTGAGPLGLAAGDLNRDGKLDVVTANNAGESLSVFLGDGSGGFGAATTLSLAAGNKPREVVIGDFNRDGRPDIAASSNTTGNVGRVTVFLQDALGAFTASPAIAVGTSARQIVSADFNVDGALDLAVANFGSDNVSILLGTGTGSFGAATNVATVAGPAGLAVGDFGGLDIDIVGGDGKPDLVVADSGANSLTYLRNNGSGGFTLEYTHNIDTTADAIAAADMNRDGLLDAVIVNKTDFTITIALGNGDGTFQYPSNFVLSVGSAPNFVTTGDINRNGTQDLMVATSGNISTLMNSCPTADLAITKTHSGTISQGQSDVTFAIVVTNVGGSGTTGTITVTDVPPAGVTIKDMTSNGPQFFCDAGSGTCSTPFPLGAGQSFPTIYVTVDIPPDAQNNIANTATITFANDPNSANDSATDPMDVQAAADLTIAKTHSPAAFTQGQTGATYTITVSNAGSLATTGDVTVMDQIPLGLTPTAISGPGWDCNLGFPSCTRSDALPGGASYPDITLTVDVATDASPLITNTATVSGGGEVGTNNDTANDDTPVNQLADLTVTKFHAANFRQGEKGATFTVTVHNVGGQTTSGAVTVGEGPETGLTVTGMSGTGWTCGALSCTRSDPLDPGLDYPDITVTVDVASTAPAQVLNHVSVSGGSEGNQNNDDYTDVVDIDQITDLTITKTHSGSFIQGDSGYQYQIVVRNNGGVGSVGVVTVADSLPSGLSAMSMAGTGWSCNVSTVSCTRTDAVFGDSSYPPIILAVAVASNAPASVINTATVSGGNDAYGANNTAQDPTTVNPSSGVIAPTNLVATAISVNEVQVTWNAVTNASTYTVYRDGVPIVPPVAATSFTDTVFAGSTHVYYVTASGATTSGPSNKDIATAILFTDDPILAGATHVKAIHITEMRSAVNAVRAAAGMGPYSFTGTPSNGSRIKASDILELRAALNPARTAIGIPAVQYSNPALAIGDSVRADDIQELRTGVK